MWYLSPTLGTSLSSYQLSGLIAQRSSNTRVLLKLINTHYRYQESSQTTGLTGVQIYWKFSTTYLSWENKMTDFPVDLGRPRDLPTRFRQAHLDKVNSDLSQQMERTQTKFKSMANANAELSAKVADLSQKLASKNWQDFQHPKPHSRKTCVLGSSILRDIDPDKLENTDIICMPGGKIPTIHKKTEWYPWWI